MTVKVVAVSNILGSNNVQWALREAEALQLTSAFNRYNNLFESKCFLEDKSVLPYAPYLNDAVRELASSDTCKWVSRLLDIPIFTADVRHYGGLFIYNHGDYLAAHVDAGMHPNKSLRKVATACLYLTPAILEFYRGDNCTDPDPYVWSKYNVQYVKPDQCVFFSNTNDAWHGVPKVTETHQGRVVLTVSYLAPPEFEHREYTNSRTRAYFARTAWDRETLQRAALRQARASETEHQKVYRTEQ